VLEARVRQAQWMSNRGKIDYKSNGREVRLLDKDQSVDGLSTGLTLDAEEQRCQNLNLNLIRIPPRGVIRVARSTQVSVM
jgi:hypothetical protein